MTTQSFQSTARAVASSEATPSPGKSVRRTARPATGGKSSRRPRRSRKASQSSARPSDENETGGDIAALITRMKGAVATGYGVSAVVHVLLLIALSLIVLTSQEPDEPTITSVFSKNEVYDLLDIEDADITLEPLDIRQPPNPAEMLAAATPEIVSSILSPDSTAESGEGDELATAAGFAMPGGGRAVTKGSFTTWTVPEDPAPREDYLVVIQIRLPEKIKKYRKEDLTGFLEGDDGYQTPLGDFKGKGFPKRYYGQFDDEARQFVIRIPGGAAKVQDTITIQSKVLREKQTLEITF